ncbi:restriction endonuclease subunit S [Solidesulfovibrio alcoholivorans]|uniref:restriction endonuclease subunit S n=1 Tax=Solidesulfovibrio alcoholivorans TaxID=81406 RepID=UPI000495E105|nr:restriction endonuclease subunit S [Solidesulfovibrio alcoholivorans]
MKYPAYPKYKDSGVAWLGEVPEHWEVKRLKNLLVDGDGIKIGPFGSALRLEEMVDVGVKVYGQENIINNDFDIGHRRISIDKHKEMLAYNVRHGDILVTMMGTSGKCKAVPENAEPGIIDSHLLRLRIVGAVCKEFLVMLIDQSSIVQNQINFMGQGSIMQGINSAIVKELVISFPPLPEQRAIAAFLDAQTSNLDTLIAKKRELIDKLKEKRAALITRTVTRGLPPDAATAAGLDPHPKMKDSGVEWLGEVPEHWEVAVLRRFIRFITSGSRGWAEYYADDGDIFVRIGNLTRHSIRVDLTDIQYVDPPQGAEGERTRIEIGDLLFSITAYLGSVSVATIDVAGGYINQHIALVRIGMDEMMPEYVAYSTLADFGQAQLNGQGYGGTKIQLSLDDVKSLWVPVPPLPEQRAIAAYLDRETAAIDVLVAKVETAIDRLQEYRAALITAAVTGQIDIREAVQ